ncbi:MAG: DUF1707 SHOCT-like domain-containing protein [Longimicrobiaceae bacterium]
MNAPAPSSPLAAERERVVAQLCAHFAHDHLDEHTLEERLDSAHRAGSTAELKRLTADLPVLPGTGPAELLVPRVDPSQVRPWQPVLAVMGGTEMAGSWTPARKVLVVGIMGCAELDFRNARFGSPVVEVTALALMGCVEILVPPNLRVETNGLGLMGGFGWSGRPRPEGDADAPLIRVNGVGVMGAVEISVRRAGESVREARRREKLERRERQRLGGGR